MAERIPKSREIEKHKVFSLDPGYLDAGKSTSMLVWAQKWLIDEVLGIQAHNTAIAKRRDLKKFFEWFYETNGTLDISDWLPRDTAGYLSHLEDLGRAPATVNRALATLRRWARWSMETGQAPFVKMPTKGVKERVMEEPDAKKLSQKEINRLFKAADKLVITDKRKNSRPRRNRAILAVAYYTGLRVSEICDLNLLQFEENHFNNIIRKGSRRTRKMYVSKSCRALLDDYIETERAGDVAGKPRGSLFLPSSGGDKLGRLAVWRIFQKLSREASAHLVDSNMRIHPHQLRHTFGYEIRQRTGSDTETAALLGHAGLKYVGRYVRATDEERAAVLENL